MGVRRVTARSALTVAGAVMAALLAAILALVVNIGILHAAGQPSGPGRLDRTSVEAPVHGAATPAPPRREHPAREDRSTPSPSPAPSWSPAPARSAGPAERERGHRFGSHADD